MNRARTVASGSTIEGGSAILISCLVCPKNRERYTPGLWADEAFSLAMATGHSLEHPASAADVTLGDYVEAPSYLTAADYRRYGEHQQPLEGPDRVIRAVALSDTNPPGYYLLLYGWTLIFGTGNESLRSLSVLASMACFPFLARSRHGCWWPVGGAACRRAVLRVSHRLVLFERRSHVCPDLAPRGLGRVAVTTTEPDGRGTLDRCLLDP